MIRGHEAFADHFAEFDDCYIAIGGLAAFNVLQEEQLPFRATKDFDLILVIEALSPKFFNAFWDFIVKGNYQKRVTTESPRKYYRFTKPTNKICPAQIELFARLPDAVILNPNVRITPIPAGEEAYSLSAILMNDDYYEFTKQNSLMSNGIRIANGPVLICLKAYAYLNLLADKNKGVSIDSRMIDKHMKDIFRLAVTITGAESVVVPSVIMSHLQEFIELMETDAPNLKQVFRGLGITSAMTPEVLLEALKQIFVAAK